MMPDPKSCTWLEAEDAACLLESLAAELAARVDVPPVYGRSDVANARWLGQRSMLNSIRFRAMRYRRHQRELLAPPEPYVPSCC